MLSVIMYGILIVFKTLQCGIKVSWLERSLHKMCGSKAVLNSTASYYNYYISSTYHGSLAFVLLTFVFCGACNFLQMYFFNTFNSNNALSAFAFKSCILSKDGLSVLNSNMSVVFAIIMCKIALPEHNHILA